MVFIKNPEAGNVKTRLAASVGNEEALQVYLRLLNYTIEVSKNLNADKQVWYSSFIDKNDNIPGSRFQKKVQSGSDLGERMTFAFEKAFGESYKKVVIIGSDCPGITVQLLEKAYSTLESKDLVVGPSEDGGYYLLGMNAFYPELFSGIKWSTGQVLSQSLSVARKIKLDVHKLPVLNDIDTEEDLRNSQF